ncbi:class I SAM-dependent methyltransferase [Chlamydiales bacterium]|nr:class I SAM-dependent methyltransferase [Chlamydiales bacterium]
MKRPFIETLSLIYLQMKTNLLHGFEWGKDIFYYYPKISFALTDIGLLTYSLCKNPFRISRQYIDKENEKGLVNLELFTYGETPLTTMDLIVKECQITPQDHLLEMGSGRGRLSFWLSQVIGCEVTGVEAIPKLYQISKKIQDARKIKNLHFIEGDFFTYPLDSFTVIYLYGSCLTDEQINQLTAHLKKTPPGTKVITVSYPLTDDAFKVMRVFNASFFWGEAQVFLNVRV